MDEAAAGRRVQKPETTRETCHIIFDVFDTSSFDVRYRLALIIAKLNCGSEHITIARYRSNVSYGCISHTRDTNAHTTGTNDVRICECMCIPCYNRLECADDGRHVRRTTRGIWAAKNAKNQTVPIDTNPMCTFSENSLQRRSEPHCAGDVAALQIPCSKHTHTHQNKHVAIIPSVFVIYRIVRAQHTASETPFSNAHKRR